MNERYTCTRVGYDATSQTGKPDFHNKNRVSTAIESSHMQLCRFRVHFKRENFFRKRKQLTKSSAKLLPSTAIFSVSVGKRVHRENDRTNMLMRNGAIR